jgi:hypothetical protein
MLQPNLTSKLLSLVVVFLLLSAIGLVAYLPSALKGDVDASVFTVSQSLAFSIKPLFVVLLTIAMSLLIYLIYYRGHAYIVFRICLIVIMYSFIISILWVTTYYNNLDHYILAGIIFSAATCYIMLNSYVISKGLGSKNNLQLLMLKGISILAILGVCGLIAGNLPMLNYKIPELFPSSENYMLFVQGLSIIALGFI